MPPASSTPGATRPPRDLFVVSDLHLGRGLDPATRRFHRLEAFLYDDDFRDFCAWICANAKAREQPAALVLNGDVFDLLRIEPEPVPGGTAVERRFGPLPTPPVAARIVTDILAGHPAFAEALADVLAAGNEVLVVCGNHDIELQWPQPQEAVRSALRPLLRARGAEGALERLAFHPWFIHEPGRIWIEHGCQYDPENSFRFPLRSVLASSPVGAEVAERDLPLGNFFQKYLYNAFGSLTFIVPSSRANYRYFRYLLATQPRLLWRIARSQGRFLLQLVRRLALPAPAAWQRVAEVAHRAELDALAERSGLGDRLRAIDALKVVGDDAARAVSGFVRQATKLAGGAAAGGVAVLALLIAMSHAIESLSVGFGLKALLSLVLYLAFGALGVSALVAAAVRQPRDEPPRPLRAAAERIAGIVDVPLVTFGHTHEEVVAPIERTGGRGWYFNTGTWVAVFSHHELVPRERVQYTFLRVRGSDAELLQWSPGRGRPMRVVLFDEDLASVAPAIPERAEEASPDADRRAG